MEERVAMSFVSKRFTRTLSLCTAVGGLGLAAVACGSAKESNTEGRGGGSPVGMSGSASDDNAGSSGGQFSGNVSSGTVGASGGGASGTVGSAGDIGAAGQASVSSGGSDDAGDHASGDGGTEPTGETADAGGALAGEPLNRTVAPGGNFDLSLWELQEPIGAVDNPTTILPGQLTGSHGFQDMYFFTDQTTGAMDFFDPSTNCVTTGHSLYCRSELREMTAGGAEASWPISGTNTLSATLAVTQVPDHVCVGQIHIGVGTPVSTKPLVELYYFATGGPGGKLFPSTLDGKIVMTIESSPSGGDGVYETVAAAPLGTKWSYLLSLTGTGANAVVGLSINGGTTLTWPMPASFADEGMYFKAGDYDQTAAGKASIGASVSFYALQIAHKP
jgi:alginate lyase